MALQDDRRANAAQAERLHKFAHDLRNRLAGLQQVIQHLGASATTEEAKELYEFGMQQQFKAMRQGFQQGGFRAGAGHGFEPPRGSSAPFPHDDQVVDVEVREVVEDAPRLPDWRENRR